VPLGFAEFGFQERLDEIPATSGPLPSSAHAQNIHVIVFARLRAENDRGPAPARMPRIFIGADEAPTPLPQIATPTLTTYPATTACRERHDKIRVIIRLDHGYARN